MPSREAVVGCRAAAAATHGFDAGSKDFVPVPSREAVVGASGVAAAVYGSD